MRFFVRLIAALVVFIGILLWLQENSQPPPTTPAPTLNTPVAAPTTTTQPDPYPPLQMTRPPQATAPPPAPNVLAQSGPAVGAMAASPGCNHVRGLAPKARVTVVSCLEKDGWTVVTVSGQDRNRLNDFLDVCQLNGMRDLASDQVYRQLHDAQQRPVHLGTFRMKF